MKLFVSKDLQKKKDFLRVKADTRSPCLNSKKPLKKFPDNQIYLIATWSADQAKDMKMVCKNFCYLNWFDNYFSGFPKLPIWVL